MRLVALLVETAVVSSRKAGQVAGTYLYGLSRPLTTSGLYLVGSVVACLTDTRRDHNETQTRGVSVGWSVVK